MLTREELNMICHCLRQRVQPMHADEGVALVNLAGALRAFYDDHLKLVAAAARPPGEPPKADHHPV